jgi:addiction module RelB/DinJ family antitoxin
MDDELKRQFDALCADFGMNATTAFNIFARAVVREKRIPFEIQASDEIAKAPDENVDDKLRAKKKGVHEMSNEEIDAEL